MLQSEDRWRRIDIWNGADSKGAREVIGRDGADGSSGDAADERDRFLVCFSFRTCACCGVTSVFIMACVYPA